MKKISELDHKIVQALSQDARKSNREIAREIGISDTYVRKRLLRLQENGAIRIGSVSAILNLGLNFVAEVMVAVRPSGVSDFIALASKIEGITLIAKISGKYDVLLSVTVRNIEEFEGILANQIRSHPDVLDIAYHIVKTVYKHRSDIAAIREPK
ncbi:MAG TPA: Lrp/AsnC family transcriptional regulator [Rhizomicrobium sp.]|nr:Lrp/AsnC family transcriptional regulator [Rhizomicrobium sp.]